MYPVQRDEVAAHCQLKLPLASNRTMPENIQKSAGAQTCNKVAYLPYSGIKCGALFACHCILFTGCHLEARCELR